MRRITLVTILLLLIGSLTHAQDSPTATPNESGGQDVEIEGSDGRTLYGTYFDPGGDAPAVLLLHQLYTNRSSWTPLIYPLVEAGFKVLAVDLRGYGQTRGAINWEAAEADNLLWGDWLRTQPGVSRVLTVGSSMGSNLALNACASIEGCGGAVALSPSLNYFDVVTEDALAVGFPVLIVYAENDRYPKADVPGMLELGAGHTESLVYPGRTHGVDLFDAHDDLIPTLVTWLQGR